MSRNVLVLCTANVCRSPVAQRVLEHRIGGEPDIYGSTWSITSAAIAPVVAPMDRHTIAAAAEVGIDLRSHRPRLLDEAILSTEGSDLILVMTRAQLRHVVGIDNGVWPRTFTLKELARRAAAIPRPQPIEGFQGWLQRLSEGRRTAELMFPDPADDVADPYGYPRRAHVATVAELSAEIDALIDHGPWRCPRGDAS